VVCANDDSKVIYENRAHEVLAALLEAVPHLGRPNVGKVLIAAHPQQDARPQMRALRWIDEEHYVLIAASRSSILRPGGPGLFRLFRAISSVPP
jgi:hypothetical protein